METLQQITKETPIAMMTLGQLEEHLAEKDGDANYVTYLEKEADSLREHHREVMAELRKESEIIAGLIRKKEIDRKALSTAAGNIGSITWREAGR